MIRRGYNLTGKEGHHWLLHQGQGLGKEVPEVIKNQPWNIKPLSETEHDLAHHGNLFQRYWYGTPGWFKALNFSYGGRGLEIGVKTVARHVNEGEGKYE